MNGILKPSKIAGFGVRCFSRWVSGFQIHGQLGKCFFLGGGFNCFFIFTSTWGNGIQFDEHIFQTGGSTTNYLDVPGS